MRVSPVSGSKLLIAGGRSAEFLGCAPSFKNRRTFVAFVRGQRFNGVLAISRPAIYAIPQTLLNDPEWPCHPDSFIPSVFRSFGRP
jgi:hypothetical protein